MKTNITRFGQGITSAGRRALYCDTAGGKRLWLIDVQDIHYIGTLDLIDLLNAGLAAPDRRALSAAMRRATGDSA